MNFNISVDARPDDHAFPPGAIIEDVPVFAFAAFTVNGKHLKRDNSPLIRLQVGKKYTFNIRSSRVHPFYFSASAGPGGNLNDKTNVMRALLNANEGAVLALGDDARTVPDNALQVRSGNFAVYRGTLTLDLTRFDLFRTLTETFGYNCSNHAWMGGPIAEEKQKQQQLSMLANGGSRISMRLEPFIDNVNLRFRSPIALATTPALPGNFFVAEQHGRVWRVFRDTRTNRVRARLFLSVERFVRNIPLNPSYDERGLLDVAFPPDYPQRSEVYIYYSSPTRTSANHIGCLSVFQVDTRAVRAIDGTERSGRANSEVIMIRVSEPFSNHNSGRITFGPRDGYLYLTLGDGGSANDPGNRAQNMRNVHGKVLRIDHQRVDPQLLGRGPEATELLTRRRYAVPPDNPFSRGVLPEIYALGVRNPWGSSWTEDGRLVVADVGQNAREELDVVERGKNYGWALMEGTRVTRRARQVSTERLSALTLPVFEYPNTGGNAIIGGYQVRGTQLYVFADFTGTLFVVRMTTDGTSWQLVQRFRIGSGSLFVNAFGRDEQSGDIYVLTTRTEGPGESNAPRRDEIFRLAIK